MSNGMLDSREVLTKTIILRYFTFDASSGKFYRIRPNRRKKYPEDGSVNLYKKAHRHNVNFSKLHVCVLWLAWTVIYDQRPPKGFLVEPYNGDYTDGRQENLFLKRRREKISDIRTSLYDDRDLPTGVTRTGGKFKAQIKIEGKNHYLGMFDNPDKAGKVFSKVRDDLHKTGRGQILINGDIKVLTLKSFTGDKHDKLLQDSE